VPATRVLPQDDARAVSPNERLELKVQVHTGIDQVPAQEWDALVEAQSEVNPFLRHAFLHCLEASGSAVRSADCIPLLPARSLLLYECASVCM
jgi:predicted N-acyltransferase